MEEALLQGSVLFEWNCIGFLLAVKTVYESGTFV